MEEKLLKYNVLQKLGKNIKQIRLLKNLSQVNLASDLQKSVNFLSLLENGKTGLSIQTIIDICSSLNVDANAIFSGIIPVTETKPDAFIINALNLFDEKDKAIVRELITYIFVSSFSCLQVQKP